MGVFQPCGVGFSRPPQFIDNQPILHAARVCESEATIGYAPPLSFSFLFPSPQQCMVSQTSSSIAHNRGYLRVTASHHNSDNYIRYIIRSGDSVSEVRI